MWKRKGRPASVAMVLCVAMAAAIGAAPAEEEEGATYARVRHLEDDMTIARASGGELFAASLNAPIVPGDRAWTEGSRAEIELADASLLWLDEWTRVGFRSLTDVAMSYAENNLIVLEEGSIRINTYDPQEDAQVFQIDTEAGTVYLVSGGEFRIDAGGGETTLSTISGVAELSGDGGSILVRSGERSSVRIGRTPSEPRHFNTARLDEFDRYCEDRTLSYLRVREETIPVGVREEVPVEVHHYVHELSIYGRWYSVPSYGWVWRPAYHGAWGPYNDGYWTWCAGGWSWVSYEPWGWAPYHYGRWDHVAGIGWVWIPGRLWSGAWVSFAVGPAYVAWAPLNYYNRPVFHDARFDARVTVRGSDLRTGGWRFARYEQFARRDRSAAQARGERMPQDSEAVITRNLPRFDSTATAKRTEPGIRLIDTVQASRVPLPNATDDAGREIPFSRLERPSAGGAHNSQRGRTKPRDLSAAVPQAGRREVPVRPRGRSGPLPPSGQSGIDGAPGSGDGTLRRTPRSSGLKLEQEGGAAADPGTTGRKDDRVAPRSTDRTPGQEEKRRRHAVEQLFRGSRQRTNPRPLSEEAGPGRTKATPQASQKRSNREQETRERGKRAGGDGETARKPPPDQDKETPRRSPERGKSGSKNSSGKRSGNAGKSPDRKEGRSTQSAGRRSERSDESSVREGNGSSQKQSSRGRGSGRQEERSRGR